MITNSKIPEGPGLYSGCSILACMNRIVKALEAQVLDDNFLKNVEKDTEVLCSNLSVTPLQSVLMSAIAEESGFTGRAANRDLLKLLKVTNIEMASMYKDIEELSRKHIVRITSDNRFGDFYQIYEDAAQAMMANVPYSVPSNVGIGTEGVFSRMRMLFAEFFADSLPFGRLTEELESLVTHNPSSGFCSKIRESGISDDDSFAMFMYLCHRLVSHGENDAEVERLISLTDEKRDDRMVGRQIRNGKTRMQEMHLVDFSMHDGFVDTARLCLCDSTIEEFLGEIRIDLCGGSSAIPEMKDHTLIPEKKLFFNSREEEQVGRLLRLLTDENFRGIQERLKEQGLREGVNVLLYGPPGTGKTETCLQLARMTGRDVFCVDVSKLKSKWVGDSEKAVRNLFSSYRNIARHCKRVPILLFNEADAIFSTRMKDAERSVDKLNNTIQNIILMEMETLEGILIATTNLETNLDQAFDRRFLFKIRLGLPEADARMRIWKSMLPHLTDSDAEYLSREYCFSGGQIENVTRKHMIGYILDGKNAGIDDIRKFCDEECMDQTKHSRKIGFLDLKEDIIRS